MADDDVNVVGIGIDVDPDHLLTGLVDLPRRRCRVVPGGHARLGGGGIAREHRVAEEGKVGMIDEQVGHPGRRRLDGDDERRPGHGRVGPVRDRRLQRDRARRVGGQLQLDQPVARRARRQRPGARTGRLRRPPCRSTTRCPRRRRTRPRAGVTVTVGWPAGPAWRGSSPPSVGATDRPGTEGRRRGRAVADRHRDGHAQAGVGRSGAARGSRRSWRRAPSSAAWSVPSSARWRPWSRERWCWGEAEGPSAKSG